MDYQLPTGAIYAPFNDILNGHHTLIAGATGSGKSVLLNGLIYTALYHSPARNRFILIDLKKVELWHYAKLPHTLAYTDSYTGVERVTAAAVAEMKRRFTVMREKGIKDYPGAKIYFIIDEYADIKLNCSRSAIDDLSLIATQGRAAGIHLIIATQRPTRDIINPLIKANTPVKIGLRTDTPQESRNIIGTAAAYNLPLFGEMLFKSPAQKAPERYTVPLIPEKEINRIIDFWTPA